MQLDRDPLYPNFYSPRAIVGMTLSAAIYSKLVQLGIPFFGYTNDFRLRSFDFIVFIYYRYRNSIYSLLPL